MAQHRPLFLRSATLFAALAAIALAHPAVAQIYSWKDKDGRVHYSDTPPASGDVKLIGPARRAPPPAAEGEDSAAPAAPEATPQQTLAERELEFRQRRAAAAEAAAKAAEERERAEHRQRVCSESRGQLAALQGGQRMARFNEAGEREFLDDAARSAEIERLQQFLSRECN